MWYIFVHHLPCHKKEIWYKLRQSLGIFLQILSAINKVQLCCSILSIKTCSRLVSSLGELFFDPVKFKMRFLFCDCLSLLFIDTPHSVFCSVSHCPSFHPRYRQAKTIAGIWKFFKLVVFSLLYPSLSIFYPRLKWLSGSQSSPHFVANIAKSRDDSAYRLHFVSQV